MDLELQSKTAFISGSTSGIGLAIARHLLKEGASVIINGRDQKRMDETIKVLKITHKGAQVQGIAADFANAAEVELLLHKIPEVDILVNNVGIFEPKAFGDIPDKDWFRFFEVNVMSGVRLSRRLLPGMLSRNWGRIIFISSESGMMIPEDMIHYGMTKTAQLAVSRGLAETTKGTNVTVNAVLPGPTWSEGAEGFISNLAKEQGKTLGEVESAFFQDGRPTSLLQRFATTDEVANMVTYLVSPLASATNGAAVRVDGGVVKSVF